LLGALAGIVQSSGEVFLGATALHALPAHKRIGVGLALVPEMRGNIFPTLSSRENLQIAMRHLDGDAYEDMRREIFDLFPRLSERLESPAQMLSGGEQQMLAIAMAL